jgi:hypothetical protein
MGENVPVRDRTVRAVLDVLTVLIPGILLWTALQEKQTSGHNKDSAVINGQAAKDNRVAASSGRETAEMARDAAQANLETAKIQLASVSPRALRPAETTNETVHDVKERDSDDKANETSLTAKTGRTAMRLALDVRAYRVQASHAADMVQARRDPHFFALARRAMKINLGGPECRYLRGRAELIASTLGSDTRSGTFSLSEDDQDVVLAMAEWRCV